MASVLLAWNHPILIAERLATLDIVSGGRAEICTARSNNLYTLEAFGVDPSDTVAQWADGMDVLGKALTQDWLEHDGPVWKIPPRRAGAALRHGAPPAGVAGRLERRVARQGGRARHRRHLLRELLRLRVPAGRASTRIATVSRARQPDAAGPATTTWASTSRRRSAPRRARRRAASPATWRSSYFQFILDLYIPLGQRRAYGYLAGTIDAPAGNGPATSTSSAPRRRR